MSQVRVLRARAGVVGDELLEDVAYAIDEAGRLVWAGSGALPHDVQHKDPLVEDLGPRLVIPGMVNAHSHAFQRGLRGMAQTPDAADPSDFWRWRDAMYRTANELDPRGLYRATRACFAEMLRRGITTVGEFHYVHHQVDGTPYDDPNELSKQVIAAAEDVGIRLVLLEVLYQRGGHGKPPAPEQRRFCDASVDAYLARIDDLRSAGARVGLAPHSIRAVDPASLPALSAYALQHDLVMHAHVSEQQRENEESIAETGASPVQAFVNGGCLDRERRFTAVHAVYVDSSDMAALGRQFVCACPTTEADLGDGILPAPELIAAGTKLCLGSDQNSIIDLIQEARCLELHARLAAGKRLRVGGGAALLRIATEHGAESLGVEAGRLEAGRLFDAACIDLSHPLLADRPMAFALDTVLLSGTGEVVDEVFVGGRRSIISDQTGRGAARGSDRTAAPPERRG